MKRAADKIVVAAHSFPKSVAGDDDGDVRVRFALFGIIKSPAVRLRSYEREKILRGEECEAAPHLVIAADSGDGEFERGHIGKNISAVFAEFAILVVGKLAVIVTGVLPRGENLYHLVRADQHRGMKHGGCAQSEKGGSDADR